MLHQKELVLNANDTENFLKGITTLRDMTAVNGSIESSIASAVGAMIYKLSGFKTGNISNESVTSNNSNNIFNITAEFPNVNNVDDIRQAILSLPNLASQYIGKNVK